MKIDKNTKILQLLEENPNLLDVLVGISPEFKKLRNPLLRKTIGRFATLEHAAQTSGVPFEELSRKVAEAMIHAPPDIEEKASQTPEERAGRIEALKEIVRGLHEGIAPETQKVRFAEMLQEVSASEIAEMEQSLISRSSRNRSQVVNRPRSRPVTRWTPSGERTQPWVRSPIRSVSSLRSSQIHRMRKPERIGWRN
jgi:hypothetical protein